MNLMLEPGIFRHPRPKSSLLTPRKKRKTDHKIDEIAFDTTSREEYLTGFHKRKVARAKAAQIEAAKKLREERLFMRKQLREQRKQGLEEHVEAVNAVVRDVEGADDEGNADEQSWTGIEDSPSALEMVDHEEEYVDDDRYTTVTVEAVNVSKDGLLKNVDDEETKAYEAPTLVEMAKDSGEKKWPKKVRKKRFRYESKLERKISRAKQKSVKQKQADARKGTN